MCTLCCVCVRVSVRVCVFEWRVRGWMLSGGCSVQVYLGFSVLICETGTMATPPSPNPCEVQSHAVCGAGKEGACKEPGPWGGGESQAASAAGSSPPPSRGPVTAAARRPLQTPGLGEPRREAPHPRKGLAQAPGWPRALCAHVGPQAS